MKLVYNKTERFSGDYRELYFKGNLYETEKLENDTKGSGRQRKRQPEV